MSVGTGINNGSICVINNELGRRKDGKRGESRAESTYRRDTTEESERENPENAEIHPEGACKHVR